MAFAIVVLIIAVSALVTGGKIHNLKYIQFRFAWLVFFAVAVKIVTNSNLRYALGISDLLAPILYVGSLTLVAVFVILNIHLRGLPFVGLGLISNLLAIAFNSGHMPIKSEYVSLIATAEELERFNQGLPVYNYIASGPDTKFYYLSDIFLMPHWIFLTKIFSVGDVLITIGGAIFVWTSLKSISNKDKNKTV